LPYRRKTSVRYVVAILGLLLIIALLGAIKGGEIAKLASYGREMQKSGPPPETVSTSIAQTQTWQKTLSAIGSIASERGVTVTNDASGIVARIDFHSGDTVKQGQELVELDSKVERAQLSSARARRELSDVSVHRTRRLVSSGALAQSQLDNDQSQYDAANADVRSFGAQIERKIVRAPFAGRIGIRQINLGQYLGSGSPIAVLESTEANYADFALPQEQLGLVHVGLPVRLTLGVGDAGAGPPPAEGVIAALDPNIDETTRNVKLRASVPRKEDWVRPGMFVNVEVLLPESATVVAAPAVAIVHASFGDSVFVVEDEKDPTGKSVTGANGKPAKVARQQFVRLGESRGDFVAIADGLQAGQEVVVGGAFKLRNGARVLVDNAVELHPELSPRPENR
jgi:membrane fusion protein (multidrug efflux system)